MPGKANAGCSVVEVLIALLLLGIVLSGTLGLQAAAVRRAQELYLQGQGMLLAADMAARMRVNAVAARHGAYLSAAQGAPPPCLGAAVVCRGYALAQVDLREWRALLEELLPEGQGSISAADRPGGYQVRVHWASRQGGAPDCPDIPPRRACSVFSVVP